jgi:hypothetical protein
VCQELERYQKQGEIQQQRQWQDESQVRSGGNLPRKNGANHQQQKNGANPRQSDAIPKSDVIPKSGASQKMSGGMNQNGETNE